jgi:hypothetical protein
MPWKLNRTWRVVGIVLVLLVAFRVALPYIVTRYVNKVLNDLEGYRGSVDDVDIQLYRAAYQIDSLRLFKLNGNEEIPFAEIPLTDLSIEWESLLHGTLVGKIRFEQPEINFIGEIKDHRSDSLRPHDEQTGKEVDWTAPIRKLFPFDINRISVDDGMITFYDLSTDPEVDVFLNNVQVEALNLTNATDNPEDLPSRIYMQALSIGNGQLNLAMKLNIQKQMPDLDMDLRFENVDLKALNDFFKAYGNVNVDEGTFTMYSEMEVVAGQITGYVKPHFTGIKVAGSGPASGEASELVWESMVGFLTEVFQRQKKDQFATRVPVQGSVTGLNSPLVPVLWGAFGNAFAGAFEPYGNPTLTLASADRKKNEMELIRDQEDNNGSKKELRKEKRKEKKDERRRNRRQKKAKMENEKADKKGSKDNS